MSEDKILARCVFMALHSKKFGRYDVTRDGWYWESIYAKSDEDAIEKFYQKYDDGYEYNRKVLV